MKEQCKQEKVAKTIDCRTCQHYNNMRGRCHSTTVCVLADAYKSKSLIQLWSVPKS